MRALYIAKGELWLQRGSGSPQRIESKFAQDVVARDEQSRRAGGWKNAPREEQRGVIPNSMLWGRRAPPNPLAPPRFLYAAGGADDDSLYYMLSVGESVGLFELKLAEQREIRLFHRNGFNCLGFDYSARDKRLILARAHEDGTAHLEVYDDEGNCKGAVTGGDCVDAAPSFSPSEPSVAYYQSCGVARHPQRGHAVAFGPAVINRVDYASGKLDTLIEDAKHDLIAPRADRDGNLYFIRRPFEKPVADSIGGAAKDTLLFPWRLAKAIFGYLNFFSMIYGREPLRSAGGPRAPEMDQDLGRLWLHGRMIELSKVQYDAQRGGGLVPRSWQLVRRDRGGREEVIDHHVVSFDIADDGSVIYSNGFELLRAAGSQPKATLGRADLVETVSLA